MNLTIDAQNNISWTIGVDGPTMHVQYVYGLWLKNPSQMPSGVASALAAAGITPADYAKILSLNPFSSGSTLIDPTRFLPTPHSFPYEPPATSADQVPVWKFSESNLKTTTATEQVTENYTVDLEVSASVGVSSLVKASLDVGDSFEWVCTSNASETTTDTQAASVTVGGPAYGYQGDTTDILVYWDTVYNSFMFAFATEAPTAIGNLVNASGAPVANTEVTLGAGTTSLSTFADSKGEYRFYGGPTTGTVTIGAGGQDFAATIGANQRIPALRV